MSVRTPGLNLSRSTQRKRKPLWDGLTVGLAIAVVLLGVLIFLAPKSTSPSHAPAKQVPANMATLTASAAASYSPA